MSLRKLTWLSIALVSVVAGALAFVSVAYVTGALLLIASIFAACRFASPATRLDPSELDEWCFALAGRDLFDPEATPSYEWQGFATTFVVVLRVADHPTLAKKTFFRFRDESSETQWRRLLTLVRHGPHAKRNGTLRGSDTSME